MRVYRYAYALGSEQNSYRMHTPCMLLPLALSQNIENKKYKYGYKYSKLLFILLTLAFRVCALRRSTRSLAHSQLTNTAHLYSILFISNLWPLLLNSLGVLRNIFLLREEAQRN